MTIFVQTAPQLHQRLALAIQCGDCPASQYESHALCGAAGLIGTIALVPILKEIEVLAFRRDHESVADQLPALALTFASVMAAVMLTLPHFDASGKATS